MMAVGGSVAEKSFALGCKGKLASLRAPSERLGLATKRTSRSWNGLVAEKSAIGSSGELKRKRWVRMDRNGPMSVDAGPGFFSLAAGLPLEKAPMGWWWGP